MTTAGNQRLQAPNDDGKLDLEHVPTINSVESYLNGINYTNDSSYVPTPFALKFINFIKLVNGGQGEEHKSPVMHYHMLDQIEVGGANIANM